MPLISTLEFEFSRNDDFNSRSPTLSGDGHWMAYTVADATIRGKNNLFLKNLSDGSTRQITLPGNITSVSYLDLSTDGSKLAFRANPDNAQFSQVYVFDLRSNQLQLASTTAQGQAGDKDVLSFSLSGDGKSLMFYSESSNLATGDSNGRSDVFVKDLSSGALNLVSRNAQGLIPNGFSREAVISHDGQKVLFVSNAVNLQGINDREWHLYLKDVASGSLRLIDADANGAPKGVSQLGAYAHISADGSKVVYQNYNGIYLKDLQTGAWAPVLDQRNEILFGTIEGFSSDGRYLTFSSSIGYYAKYDLDGSGANNSDLFQKDLQTGEIRLLTPHGYRSSGTGGVTVLDVSNDGQSTLFSSVNPGVFGDEPAEKDLPGPTQVYLSHNGTASNGKDALIGSYGVDRLEGGYGDDSYWIDNLNDSIIEGAGGGTDSVLALVDKIVLPDNVENLKLSSVTASGDGRVLQGTGNAQNNYISGNFNNNLLRGLGGDDIINAAGAENYAGSGGDTVDGGDGTDSLIFNTNQADARLSKLADGWTIEKILGSSNKVTLLNMERIQFYDKVLALPGDTHAAQAYRIYQAAFNRAPDQSGLGFWVKQIDNGLKLTDIASGFIQSSEFTAAYGSAPSNLDLATKFYQNVLHRNPDAGGLNFWVDALNSHRATPEMVLAQFAESPENQAALAGVIDAGITFRLFQ